MWVKLRSAAAVAMAVAVGGTPWAGVVAGGAVSGYLAVRPADRSAVTARLNGRVYQYLNNVYPPKGAPPAVSGRASWGDVMADAQQPLPGSVATGGYAAAFSAGTIARLLGEDWVAARPGLAFSPGGPGADLWDDVLPTLPADTTAW